MQGRLELRGVLVCSGEGCKEETTATFYGRLVARGEKPGTRAVEIHEATPDRSQWYEFDGEHYCHSCAFTHHG